MGKMLRPEDIDQVLFLGDHTIRLCQFRLVYPHPNNRDFSNLIYGDPKWAGLTKEEKPFFSIEDKRIHDSQIVNVNGRRTLIVTAELNGHENKSILDILLADLQNQLDKMKINNKYISSENSVYNQFIVEKHLEASWEEWLLNKLELLRVAGIKVAGKPAEVTPIAMEIGKPEEKK